MDDYVAYSILYKYIMHTIIKFYGQYMIIAFFVLCYLLFKSNPNKKSYIHLAIVVFILTFKHWSIIFAVQNKAKELGVDFSLASTFFEYGIYALLTSIFCVFILALMHRPSNIGYDVLLKKEIWGVWYKENNSTEYLTKQARKPPQGANNG